MRRRGLRAFRFHCSSGVPDDHIAQNGHSLCLPCSPSASVAPAAAQTPSPEGAKVYFINLKDGAEVDSPFLVQFGLPAGRWRRPAWKSQTPATIIS